MRHDVLIQLHQGVHQITSAVLRHASACHFRLVQNFESQLGITQFPGYLQQILIDLTEICLEIPAQPARYHAITVLQGLPELEKMRLRGINLVGMDVVEVSPPYDHAEVTALAASYVAMEMLCLYAARHKVPA